MNAFFNIAQMADEAGVDFWSLTTPSGKSLKKGFDALRPYITQEKKWEGEQIKDFVYEDGYPLLMEAATRFDCKRCKDEVQRIAGDKSKHLRLNLLY